MSANAIVDLSGDTGASVPRRIGFFTACAIVIANIIGTGVFTSLGFQLPEIHSGFALLMLWIVGGIAALCGALCYGEAERRAAAFRRRISFSLADLSSRARIHGRNRFRHGRFRRAHRARRHGVWKIFSRRLRRRLARFLSFAIVWIVALVHLSNLRVGSAFQNLWTLVKVAFDRRAHRRRLSGRSKTADHVPAATRRYDVDLRRALRRRARFRDVFLLGLECGHLHHRRNQATGKKRSARALLRHACRHRHLHRAQRRLFSWPRRAKK